MWYKPLTKNSISQRLMAFLVLRLDFTIGSKLASARVLLKLANVYRTYTDRAWLLNISSLFSDDLVHEQLNLSA